MQGNSQLAFKTAEAKQLTIREWSKKSGISEMTIRRWRAGADIKIATLAKLCKPLGLDWADIMFKGKR